MGGEEEGRREGSRLGAGGKEVKDSMHPSSEYFAA